MASVDYRVCTAHVIGFLMEHPDGVTSFPGTYLQSGKGEVRISDASNVCFIASITLLLCSLYESYISFPLLISLGLFSETVSL